MDEEMDDITDGSPGTSGMETISTSTRRPRSASLPCSTPMDPSVGSSSMSNYSKRRRTSSPAILSVHEEIGRALREVGTNFDNMKRRRNSNSISEEEPESMLDVFQRECCFPGGIIAELCIQILLNLS